MAEPPADPYNKILYGSRGPAPKTPLPDDAKEGDGLRKSSSKTMPSVADSPGVRRKDTSGSAGASLEKAQSVKKNLEKEEKEKEKQREKEEKEREKQREKEEKEKERLKEKEEKEREKEEKRKEKERQKEEEKKEKEDKGKDKEKEKKKGGTGMEAVKQLANKDQRGDQSPFMHPVGRAVTPAPPPPPEAQDGATRGRRSTSLNQLPSQQQQKAPKPVVMSDANAMMAAVLTAHIKEAKVKAAQIEITRDMSEDQKAKHKATKWATAKPAEGKKEGEEGEEKALLGAKRGNFFNPIAKEINPNATERAANFKKMREMLESTLKLQEAPPQWQQEPKSVEKEVKKKDDGSDEEGAKELEPMGDMDMYLLKEEFETVLKEEAMPNPFNTLADIPPELMERCKKHQIPEDVLEKNLLPLFVVSSFLRVSGIPRVTHPRRIAYVSDKMLTYAEEKIHASEKPLKKLFKFDDVEGKGGFGKVISAKDKEQNKRPVAIKALANDNAKDIHHNLCEIAFLSGCANKNIVLFYDALIVSKDDIAQIGSKFKRPSEVDSTHEIWIVMELMNGGTLEQAAKAQKLSERYVAYIAREILNGLAYLHERKMAHRDVKSSNVMISIEGEIKLIDFGLCADMRFAERRQICGSPYWIPPEMIRQQPHTFTCDVWSLACCILELFDGHPPLHKSAFFCMFTVGAQGLAHLVPEKASDNCKDFLKQCFEMDPTIRASAVDLLKHPWIDVPDLGEGIRSILEAVFMRKSLSEIGVYDFM